MRGPIYELAFAWVVQLCTAAHHTTSLHADLEKMAEVLADKLPAEVFCTESVRAALRPGGTWPSAAQVVERLRDWQQAQRLIPGVAPHEKPPRLTDVEWLMAKYYFTREGEGFGSTRNHASTPFPDDRQRARQHLLSSIKGYCFPAWDWLTGPDGPASDLRGRS